MSLLFIYLFIAVGVSFLSAILESVFLSTHQGYVALLIKQGKPAGKILRDLKQNVNRPLSATLTADTVATITGASGVGAEVYRLYGNEWVALSTAIMAAVMLVWGDYFPKVLGTVYWKKLAEPSAYLLKALVILTFPIVIILEQLSRFGAKGHPAKMTREEIMVLAELGGVEGTLQEKEALLIKNIFRLHDIRTGDIATPRAVIYAFQEERTIREIMEEESPIRFSRVPVYGKDLDDIKGLMIRRQFFEAYQAGRGDEPVGALVVPIFAVPEAKPVDDLLDEFIKRRQHMFLVVDEFGGTGGVVTLEDAVETLLGVEIMDEFDSVEDMRAFAHEIWKRRHPS